MPVVYREFVQGSAIAVLDLPVTYIGKSIKTVRVSAEARFSALFCLVLQF